MIYLASPYTHERPEAMHARVALATAFEAQLLNHGFVVYNPIRYAESISPLIASDFDWYAYDLEVLALCDRMVVLQLEGWDTSKGVRLELDTAESLHIPVVMADVAVSAGGVAPMLTDDVVDAISSCVTT